MIKLLHRGKIVLGTALLAAALVSGCGDSENFVFTTSNPVLPVIPVNPGQAPVAQNDAFSALGDATLNQAASGVLANDTLNGGEITAFDATASQGGSIELSADGSFTYTPVTGFVGAETFTYTISNAAGDSTATVTLTSTGFGRFVDNTVGPGGTGTQADPFNNLADALAVAQSGDTIFVATGNGTSTLLTGPIVLPQGVDLIGQGTGLILGQTIEPVGEAPVLQGPIRPEGDNLIQGITVDGSTDNNLIQMKDVSNVTVNECTLMNPDDGAHIDMVDVGGTISITNCILQSPDDGNDEYIDVENEGPSGTLVVTDNFFFNAENREVDNLLDVDVFGDSNLTVDFSRNIANGTEEHQFDKGIDCENEGTLNLTCNDNVFDNFGNTVVEVERCDSATISGNAISNVGDEEGEGIYVIVKEEGSSTITITGNMISDIDEGDGLEFEFIDDGNSTVIVVIRDNSIDDVEDNGFRLSNDYDGHDVAVALRDNSITDCGDESVDVFWDDDEEDICFEIVGNTVDEDMDFLNAGSGDINVEQANLVQDTLNTFLEGAEFDPELETSNVADGACAIP